jgi:hypothetical protein
LCDDDDDDDDDDEYMPDGVIPVNHGPENGVQFNVPEVAPLPLIVPEGAPIAAPQGDAVPQGDAAPEGAPIVAPNDAQPPPIEINDVHHIADHNNDDDDDNDDDGDDDLRDAMNGDDQAGFRAAMKVDWKQPLDKKTWEITDRTEATEANKIVVGIQWFSSVSNSQTDRSES